jgi:hypothetical protein
MRNSISETEMIVFLDEQIARLDDLTRPTWKRYRVPLRAARCERGGERGTVFVVAAAGDEVLLFDEVKEEFGTARLDADGVIREWTTYGEELRGTLRHFPRKQPGTKEAE